MTYSIHALELRKDILPPDGGAPAPDGTLEVLNYRSLVSPGDLEPRPGDHLAAANQTGIRAVIPAGRYLFTQVPYPDTEETREDAFRAAAEAVWLEALWRDAGIKNDRVLVRTLSEDGKKVFQVFREIAEAD